MAYLDKHLKNMDLKQCVTESCVYGKKSLFVGIYVEDGGN